MTEPEKPKKYYPRLEVRVSAEDKARIEERALASGWSLSEYTRKMLLDGQIILIDPADRRQIVGLSNNLNQLTRQANALGIRPGEVETELRAILEELKNAYRKR